MNGFISKKYRSVLASVVLMACIGCDPAEVPKSVDLPSEPESTVGLAEETSDLRDSELMSAEILASVIERYDQAKSYQDKAVLYLNYQLEGRQTQEPQRWSTVWERGGKYA
ncbi:MAG: hypothetical protein P8R31_03250, partial [Mariniblastus sp.]|nr:hypothetical protein [Mariniblastus sp.]